MAKVPASSFWGVACYFDEDLYWLFVLLYTVRLASVTGTDLGAAATAKMRKNAAKWVGGGGHLWRTK